LFNEILPDQRTQIELVDRRGLFSSAMSTWAKHPSGMTAVQPFYEKVENPEADDCISNPGMVSSN
jgi:hypothetical protein